MEKLKVGIIGVGAIAQQNHIPVWKKLGVEIIGIDKNIDLLEKVKEKYGIAKMYTSIEEALVNENIDIIDNCTPVQLHSSLTLIALEKGCHTLVEKPMATNYNDAQKIVKLAESKGLMVGVIHNTLFNPIYLKVKKLLSNLVNNKGAEMIRADVEYVKQSDDPWIVDKNHWSHRLDLGMITEILAHPLYILDDILGGRDGSLEVLTAVGRKLHVSKKYPYVKYDELFAFLENKTDKKIGTITVTLNSNREDVILRVYTTLGIIYSSLWRGVIVLKGRMMYGAKNFIVDNIEESIGILKCTLDGMLLKFRGKMVPGHYFLIPDFYDAVIHNRKPLVSGEDGLRIAKLMEEITNTVLNDPKRKKTVIA
jgi:predicted dehydrogenase